MYYARSGVKPVLASLAVLVLLLSGGVFAYSTRLQSSGSGPSDPSNQNSQQVVFKLVSANATGAYHAAQGKAYVIVQGHTLTVYLSVAGGAPNAQLGVVMPLISDSGDSNVSLGVVKLTDGGGQFRLQTALDSGSYQVGIRLYDTSNSGSPVLALISDPELTQIVITDESSTSSTESSSEHSTSYSSTYTKSTTSNAGGGSSYLQFRLVSLPASQHQTTPDSYPFKEGEALLYFSSGQMSMKLSFKGTPNSTFSIVLQKNGQNLTVGQTTTNEEGSGYASVRLTLSPGAYQFGILLFASTSSQQDELVALSDPRSATGTISGSGTTTTTTSTTETSETETESETSTTQKNGNHVYFQLVSLPTYLLTPQPTNYPFIKGGATIGVTTGSMYVAVSFLGTPNTNFTVVMEQNGANITVGSLTTNGDGGGGLRKQLTVNSGTFEVGLLVYATESDGTSSLVAVSIPRSQTVSVTQVSETTTSTETETESSNEGKVASFTFNPAPGASVPSGYSFGHGTAGAGLRNSGILVSAGFEGQNPNTRYALVLTVNGTMHKIGEYTTDAHGNGHIVADLSLGPGTFAIGLSVYDLSIFTTPTLVLTSDPASVILSTSHGGSSSTTTTESESETQTSEQSGNEQKHELKFRIISAEVQNAPANYSFGKGEANIAISDQVLRLKMEIEHANPATQFAVALSINGTSTEVGQLATNHEGNGEIVAELKLKPGTYLIGVLVYDVSSFQAPTVVMTSDPSSLVAVVVPSGNSTTSSSSQSASESQSVTTIKAGEKDEENIKLAVSSLAIPAVVHVGSANASFSVLDPRFSVSVGRQADDGLIISISATNVTGPKVLLLNLTQNAFLKLSSNALNVTLDGNPVQQASSVTQVLNPSPGDPARYVIVAASTGIQLLISIPHFSLHTIQIIPIPISQIQSLLVVNAEVLAASVVVITILFAAVYKTRRKIFSLFL